MIHNYSEDPEWKTETYMKAAEAVGISPAQAYKWGYHQKSKNLPWEAKRKNIKNCLKLKKSIRYSNWHQKNSNNTSTQLISQ